jgi:hypothetical protein
MKKLKDWLLTEYVNVSQQEIEIDSKMVKRAYENNLLQRTNGIIEFNNYDLVGLCAFNKFNDGGGSRGNPNLWAQAIKWVTQNSTSINEKEIGVLQIEEIRILLLDYLHEGRLAINDSANSRIIHNIKTKNKKSTPLNAIKTIHEFTQLVANLPNPSVDGFISILIELAEIERKNNNDNIFESCHSLLMQVHGFGIALSMNMTKDVLLMKANKDKMSIEELKISVLGQLTKADLWTKRIFALYIDHGLLGRTENYSNISQIETENILLGYSSNKKSWKDGYAKIMKDICKQEKTFPLELDRLIYSIFSRNLNDGQETYRLPELSVDELRKILV